MIKTILIPTDFKIESLFLVKQALGRQHEKVNVMLLYCCLLPDSITDLLFYSAEKILQPLISKDFEEACTIIENKYDSLLSDMHIELFHGRSEGSFRRFTEANKITEAYIPANYEYRLAPEALDPLPFVRRSGLVIHELSWEQKKNGPEKDRLAELFLD